MEIIIAGAGVGGLAAARGLLADGHQIQVFEQAPVLRTGGAAITIFPNGAHVLGDLGVDLDGAGGRMEVLESRTWRGRTLLRLDIARLSREFGAPTTVVSRDRLLGALAERLPEGTVRFGARVERFQRHRPAGRGAPERITAHLSGGGVATGDVLIGADGHRSAVRHRLWGTDPTRPTGWISWQGLTPIEIPVTSSAHALVITGPEGSCGLLPAGHGLLQWWFDVRSSPRDVLRRALPDSPLEMLTRLFGGWAAPVPDVLAALTDADIAPFPHHRQPVRGVWGAGACTLVGDAAHTMPPSLAQGANQTLEDVWVLCRALRGRSPAAGVTCGLRGAAGNGTGAGDGGRDEIAAVLRRYERVRAGRVRPVAAVSRRELSIRHGPSVIFGLVPDRLATAVFQEFMRRTGARLAAGPAR